MVEALGVAGSVVGIVSLGIQLTQGLLKYYRSWKDQDNDISDVCASLDSLQRTLTILSKTIQPPARFDMGIKDSVEKNVNCINGALEKLTDELRKVQGTELLKSGARSAMRRHVRRALYPFREETLSNIQRVVSEARSNLDLALQVLQVGGISDIRYEVNLLVRWQEDEETQSILGWLSSVNFWLKQADVFNQKQIGTGQWLLEHPDFLEWAKGNKETVWCLGSPGVGKTVLASAVVEFLENDLPVRGIGLTFIYCNHKENLLQRIEYFIGAIVRQLVERRQAIPRDVRNLYEKHRGKGTTPTCAEYLELLQCLTKECSEVYVVIDALDECIDKKGQIIWNDLLIKLKDSISNLRLLYTSRHIDDLAGILAGSTRIEIHASEADIRAYIQAQVKSKHLLFEFCRQDSNLRNDILQVVVSKAEGMFLAARLYVESLASKTNLRAVKRALRELPATLDDSYNEAMERIKQQPTKILAMRALSWIVYAVRPLQLEEVLHAIAVDDLEPDDRSISEEILTPQSVVVNACAGMIKIDEGTNVVGLVHKTTQEYLERSGAEHFPDAQRDIGIACLKYLSLDVFSKGYCSTDELFECRLRENTLLDYAARNVGNHIRKETRRSLHDLALKFLLDKRKVLCASQALFIVPEVWRSPEYSQGFPKDFHGVHYAAYFGLMDIIKLLFESAKVDVDSKDTYGRTPLSWAAGNGHEAVVKLLLATEKVDVDPKDSYSGRTPLSWAAVNGHEAVVKLLLATEKVDLDSKSTSYGRTPLSWAAENGHEAVVKLLLETEKVDVDSKYSSGLTPLSWAAGNGHEAVVKLLLATEKVDVNSKSSSYGGRTPLSLAAGNRHEAVVKLLLKTGKVDVNLMDSNGRTPLSWAAGNGHEAVVKLLQSHCLTPSPPTTC
ncbi:MAG: hypothetical protein M1813_006406 [Trichoglossum hirsutum]|nr:MAG: hypothetical protein M1813_006406 [Trichoglossum hirsutum]